MKIVIAAAMQEELAVFRRNYPRIPYLSRGKCQIEKVALKGEKVEIYFVETGIGKVNAAYSAALICERLSPSLLINTGSAGGLSANLQIGDVVIATEQRYGDVDATAFHYEYGQVPQMPSHYKTVAESQSFSAPFVEQQTSENYQVHWGLVVTSDSFMSCVNFSEKVKAHFPKALASDMESTAIAQVAANEQIPFLNIRGISDLAGENAADTFEAQLDQAAEHAFMEVKKILDHFTLAE